MYGLGGLIPRKKGNAGYDLPLRYPGDLPTEACQWTLANSSGFTITDEGAITILPGGHYSYDTGVSADIPEGWVGLCFERTSTASKGMSIGYTVVDCNYKGPIHVRINNDNCFPIVVDKPVAQMVVVPYFEDPDDVEGYERGTKWNGSSNA